MTETPATSDPDGQHGAASAARTGRRIGVGLFWLMAVYVVGASTVSIVGQVYGAPGQPPAGTPSEATCASALTELTAKLQARTAGVMSGQGPAPPAWFDPWDRNLRNLEGRCGRLESTRQQLSEVRARVGTMLRSFHTQERPELARISRRLEPFVAATEEP